MGTAVLILSWLIAKLPENPSQVMVKSTNSSEGSQHHEGLRDGIPQNRIPRQLRCTLVFPKSLARLKGEESVVCCRFTANDDVRH